MLVCALIIFEIAVIIVLLIVAGRYAKQQIDTLWTEFAIISAYLDKSISVSESIKKDIDVKFGPDLIEKLNAIFKLGQNPKNIVLGKDGKFHPINREY
jgi:hypothetical protein